MEWWRKDPELLSKVRADVDAFTNLSLSVIDGVVIVSGIWSVFGKQHFIRDYSVKIVLSGDYPLSPPAVFEVGNVIPLGRHLNGDGTCCLFAPPERWEKWPLGASFSDFLNGAVKEYFFSQAYFELTGQWPFGEWGHNFVGVYEYYQDRLNIESPSKMLNLIGLRNKNKREVKKIACPCGKIKKYVDCHFPIVNRLNSILPDFEWKKLEVTLREVLMRIDEDRIEKALSFPPIHYLKR